MRRPTLLGFACSEHCQPDMRPHVQPDHFPPCGCGPQASSMLDVAVQVLVARICASQRQYGCRWPGSPVKAVLWPCPERLEPKGVSGSRG